MLQRPLSFRGKHFANLQLALSDIQKADEYIFPAAKMTGQHNLSVVISSPQRPVGNFMSLIFTVNTNRDHILTQKLSFNLRKIVKALPDISSGGFSTTRDC